MKRLVWIALSILVLLSACSSGPPAESATAEFSDTIDWNDLDWHLQKRAMAAYAAWCGDFDRDPAGLYRKQARFDAPWDSLGADAFAAASESEQEWRRQEAVALVKQAFTAIINRGYRLRDDAKLHHDTRSGYHLLDRVMLRVLGHLHTAVGTDPASVEAWHNLAYFSDVVGDTERASVARAHLLALAEPDDPRCVRAVLDQAWNLRDAGRYEAVVLWLNGHAAALRCSPTPSRALRPSVEADLIRALCAAEQGDLLRVRGLVARLPLVVVPDGLESRTSEFLRTWVNVWVDVRSGYPDLATNRLGRRRAVRLPAGVAWRYWQDMGLICEELDDRARARQFWNVAVQSRPYVGFFPHVGLRYRSGGIAHPEVDEPFFIAYRRFFTVGSSWGFAAGRAVMCQVLDPDEDPDLWRQAFASLDACVRRNIREPESRLLRARLNLQQGDWKAAEADLRAVAIGELTGSRSEAELEFLRGVAALNTGDTAASVEPLRRCVALDPNNARGWQTLAVGLCYLGHNQEALDAYDRVQRIQPHDGVNYFNRGLLNLQMGRTDAAEADLLNAVNFLPDNSRAIELLQAVAGGRQITVDLEPQPVQLVASDAERAMAADLDRLLVGDAIGSQMPEAFAGSAEERAMWMELLERRYREEPTADHRCRLAEASARAGKPSRVVDLLARDWPSRLSARERVLLLDADRTVGEVERAVAVAADQVPSEFLDVPVMVRAATILLDHGRDDAARRVLDRAQSLAPGEPALEKLSARLR